MEDLFMVLMERSSFVSMYTWGWRLAVESMWPFMSVIPLSFLLSAAPSFGIFLRRAEWTCIKEGPWQQRWQRAISKERVFLDSLPWTRTSAECLAEGAEFCWCLLNLIKKRSYHCTGVWEQLRFGKWESTSCSICLLWPVIPKCNTYGANEKIWHPRKKIGSLKGLADLNDQK